jgi:hypothetical protein
MFAVINRSPSVVIQEESFWALEFVSSAEKDYFGMTGKRMSATVRCHSGEISLGTGVCAQC